MHGALLWLSTCPLDFGCWLLDHVTYLKLRKKELLAKLRKVTKMITIFTPNVFLFQLKINHVIQQPKTRGQVDHQHWVSIYRFLKLVSIHYEWFHTLYIFYLSLKVVKVLIWGILIFAAFIHNIIMKFEKSLQ